MEIMKVLFFGNSLSFLVCSYKQQSGGVGDNAMLIYLPIKKENYFRNFAVLDISH